MKIIKFNEKIHLETPFILLSTWDCESIAKHLTFENHVYEPAEPEVGTNELYTYDKAIFNENCLILDVYAEMAYICFAGDDINEVFSVVDEMFAGDLDSEIVSIIEKKMASIEQENKLTMYL